MKQKKIHILLSYSIIFIFSLSINQSITRYLYLYKYEKVCVCVCFRVFLGHLESDWDTLWHKCALMPRNGSKNKISKKVIFAELLPFFYISLRVLCISSFKVIKSRFSCRKQTKQIKISVSDFWVKHKQFTCVGVVMIQRISTFLLSHPVYFCFNKNVK